MADTPIFSDSFTYADGNLTGKGSPAWVGFQSGTSFAVATNRLAAAVAAYRSNSRPSASVKDAYAEADVAFGTGLGSTQNTRLFVRLADPMSGSNYVGGLVAGNGDCLLYKVVGGVQTNIASQAGAVTFVADTYKRVRVDAYGTTSTAVRLLVDDVPILTATGQSDLNFGGTAAILSYASNTVARYLDNFEWGAYAPDASYAYSPFSSGVINSSRVIRSAL